ncbi:hypothetical protein E2320_023051 [Naja naja]|nr:hypothetical protein E2320_023051 [Naja naja]
MQEKRKKFNSLIKSQIKIIVRQLDVQASGILAAKIQIIDMTNISLVGMVWIATTLKALSVNKDMHTSAGETLMQEKRKMFLSLIQSQIKIIVCQLDFQASEY